MRALALLAAIAALLASTRIQATTVQQRAASEIFDKAAVIAVVEIESIKRIDEKASVCRASVFEIEVRLHESWKGERPKAVLCSGHAWRVGDRVLVAIGGVRDVMHAWPLERHPKGWMVRPSHADPLLRDLRPVPFHMHICDDARNCYEIDLYHYYPIEKIKHLSQSRNPS